MNRLAVSIMLAKVLTVHYTVQIELLIISTYCVHCTDTNSWFELNALSAGGSTVAVSIQWEKSDCTLFWVRCFWKQFFWKRRHRLARKVGSWVSADESQMGYNCSRYISNLHLSHQPSFQKLYTLVSTHVANCGLRPPLGQMSELRSTRFHLNPLKIIN